jgi:hypothetical protein
MTTVTNAMNTMNTVMSMPGGATDTRETIATRTGEPSVAHIVKTDGDESAAAAVLRARIEGTPIEALCGHRWIPSRDPGRLPMCQACREIYEAYRAFNDGLNETPGE